jgi:ketosteroid isomerase-like protein
MNVANEALIRDLYTAMASRDAAAMATCYTPDAHFSDPVFTDLKGPQIGAMWAMLCTRAKSLKVMLVDVDAGDNDGQAHWEAIYPFSKTGRMVHNKIAARFVIRDGKIADHHDDFPLWRWTGMALGVKGHLLGWLPPVQNAIRREAAKSLAEFMAN